jgi:hypothetical protein
MTVNIDSKKGYGWMKNNKGSTIKLYTPNVVNICVDSYVQGELKGKIHHCYSDVPSTFNNVIQMMDVMDNFFDDIAFPQASNKTRFFVEKSQASRKKPEKVLRSEEVVDYRGEIATFLVYVQFRQNSTWQGQVTWVENGNSTKFNSALELLKLMNNVMES